MEMVNHEPYKKEILQEVRRRNTHMVFMPSCMGNFNHTYMMDNHLLAQIILRTSSRSKKWTVLMETCLRVSRLQNGEIPFIPP